MFVTAKDSTQIFYKDWGKVSHRFHSRLAVVRG